MRTTNQVCSYQGSEKDESAIHPNLLSQLEEGYFTSKFCYFGALLELFLYLCCLFPVNAILCKNYYVISQQL